jgi:hypothetical protein
VTFTPTSAGTRSGTLTITDNATGGSQAVTLSGTGIAKGTSAGTYQIDVTGMFGTFTRSAPVTIIVQ